MLNNKKFISMVELKVAESCKLMANYVLKHYPDILKDEQEYEKWVNSHINNPVVNDYFFYSFLSTAIKGDLYTPTLQYYPTLDNILFDSRLKLKYKEQLDILLEIIKMNAANIAKLSNESEENKRLYLCLNIESEDGILSHDETIECVAKITDKIIDENGELRPIIYDDELIKDLECLCLTKRQINMLSFFAAKKLEEQRATATKTNKPAKKVESKNANSEIVRLNDETREYHDYFTKDGEVKPYLTERKINRLVELMSMLGYSNSAIQKTLNEIKNINKNCEQEIKANLKEEALEEIFAEQELATIDYLSLVLNIDNDYLKGINASIREVLNEMDLWLEEYCKTKDQQEKEEMQEAIKNCYQSLDDLAYNHYNVNQVLSLKK